MESHYFGPVPAFIFLFFTIRMLFYSFYSLSKSENKRISGLLIIS